jgi:hypothetical protein
MTDDQARVLVAELPAILARHPLDPRSNRPFVRDFVRVVHTATGRTYSPSIYRRLLNIYAPDRNPSNDTLEQEKAALVQALEEESRAGREIKNGDGSELAGIVGRAVQGALDRMPTSPPAPAAAGAQGDPYLLVQRDFLQTRLAECEQALNQVRALAARQAADVQAAIAVRDALQSQVNAANATAREQAARIDKLTEEAAGMRKFAMTAIDAARGETRAQQERATHLEALLKQEKYHTEVFRSLAYRNGAPIPADLQPEGKR